LDTVRRCDQFVAISAQSLVGSGAGELKASCDATKQLGFGAGGGESDANRVAVSVIRPEI